jgi:hypothetical protein
VHECIRDILCVPILEVKPELMLKCEVLPVRRLFSDGIQKSKTSFADVEELGGTTAYDLNTSQFVVIPEAQINFTGWSCRSVLSSQFIRSFHVDLMGLVVSSKETSPACILERGMSRTVHTHTRTHI